MPPSQDYTQAEVGALLGYLGRKVALLNAAIEETDQLARAGETVGYESAYRILRRAVGQVLNEPPPAPLVLEVDDAT